ncbi:MAG TPA: hypothetical protein VI300_12900 [Solirubrobacter sp.]
MGSLLSAAILLGTVGAGSALAQTAPAGPGDAPETQAATTQATVTRANDLKKLACDAATASAAAAAADPGNVAKQATAAADAAKCATATANADKESASLAGVNGGIATEPVNPVLPTDAHQTADGAVKSDNMQWVSNSRGLSNSATNPTAANGNYAGATFMHFENLGYDFLLGDGTGGLSIWSLKSPDKPLFVGGVSATALVQPADSHGPADTQARFYEGENPTVDSRRKLAFLARDPRSFGSSGHPNGRTGLYIVDVKDPWHPQVISYTWVPAGHTATCINDCRYLWSVGPANNGSHVAGQPQDVAGVLHPEWTGVPTFVTDVRDPNHPYVYANPVDLKRNNNTTAYTHSVDVDQDGLAWTSGFGGVRGYYTNGFHHDVVANTDRYATATDPIPYAGGGVVSLESDAQYAQFSLEHNSYHRTQAASDTSPKTVTTAGGRTINKTDLQYVTQENTVSCTSTSGGGAGRFVTTSLAGSYGGKAWDPQWSATDPTKRYFLEKLDDYTPAGQPGANPSAGCSAHWFSVVGDMVAIGFYGQGTRVLDVSDPTDIKQAGYFRVPAIAASGSTPAQLANNTSAAYWHNGFIYVADYTRGIDVLRYTDPIKGVVQPLVCWNACDKSQTPPKVADNQNGGAGGTVPATLALTMGTPATFGAFTPGIAKDYAAQTTANVISSAGDGQLSVADPAATATGHLVNGTFSLPSALQAKASSTAGAGGAFKDVGGSAAPTGLLTYSGPTSNDAVTIAFQQHVSANDALRTGSYSKTLTFTLSTTTP